MSVVEAIAAARQSGDLEALIESLPYLHFLGVKLREAEGGIICELPGQDKLVGNPMLPALHGGVIGALLESAAIMQLIWQREASAALPKTINLTVEYLRSAKPVTTFAKGEITKHGRRVATVRVEAWQEDRSRLVAVASAHFLLPH